MLMSVYLRPKTGILILWRLLLLLSLIAACGDDNADRPEVVKKLRTLGVELSSVNAKPGDTIGLNFYLAAAPGLSISPDIQLDSSAQYGVPILVTAVDTTPSETALGPLSLYNYRATLSVPTDNPILTAALAKQGYARMRYKVKFLAGVESETVVGDALVYAPSAIRSSWVTPDIAITKPATTAKAGNIDVEGSITSNGAEPYRVSWFVSDGKIKNRRAKITSWTDAPKGPQTLIMTVRGTKSGSFAIKSQTVTIE